MIKTLLYLAALLSLASCASSQGNKHVKVTVYDTTHVRVYKYDTTHIKITVYDTVRKTDTVHKSVIRVDTVHKIVYDTSVHNIIIDDTIIKTITDTVHKLFTILDTVKKITTIIDTVRKQYVKTDTLLKTVIIRDTNYRITTIKDTITLYDTVKIQFGAKVDGVNYKDQVLVLKSLGVNIVRPLSVELKSYYGVARSLQSFYDSGFKCVVNIVWNKTNSSPFVSSRQLDTFRTKLTEFLQKYHSMIYVAVIENEPVNLLYYTSPVEDYVSELKIAVELCHKYGVKVADGSLPAEAVDLLARETRYIDSKLLSVQKLILAYKTIPLDYVNTHIGVNGSTVEAGLLKRVCDYIRTKTGHTVISNEWHVESATTSLITQLVSEWRRSGVTICMIWGGGSGSPAEAINTGSELTDFGITYKNAIHENKN